MSLLVWLLGCFFALLLACCWTSLLLLQSLWCLLVWWLAGWLAFMSECVCGWFVVANDRWQKGGQEQDHDQEHEQEQEHEQKQKQEQEQEQNQKQEPDFGTHLYGNMSKLIFFLWMPRIFLRHLLYFHRCSTCRFSNMQQLIDFAWIPRSGRVFLEPICVWAFTNSHFFKFRHKKCDPP